MRCFTRLVLPSRRSCATAAVTAGALCVAVSAAPASAGEIEVFTTRSISLNPPPGTSIVYLDTAGEIEERLSSDLPADQQRAETIARQRLLDGGAKLQRDLAAAYQGVTDAWSLGITSLPAVVVDRRYVIYGDADVAKAVARIEEYRRTQQ